METKKLKVRWAFDPYLKEPELWGRSIDYLLMLQENTGAEITPTYIIGSEITDWVAHSVPNQGIDIFNAVTKSCEEKLKELEVSDKFKPTEVFRSSAFSKREDSLTMLDNMGGFDLLLVDTHARRGIKRLFMGSFAENIMLKSKKPVLFMSPHTEKTLGSEKTLFPTGFTKSSKEVFVKFLNSPLNMAKEIVLYSKVIHPATAFVSGTSVMFGGDAIFMDKVFAEERGKREDEALKWKALAEGAGFKFKFILDETPAPIADSILEVASNESCHLIAMSSLSGELETVFVGSETREVVRQSTIPVLVWHI